MKHLQKHFISKKCQFQEKSDLFMGFIFKINLAHMVSFEEGKGKNHLRLLGVLPKV